MLERDDSMRIVWRSRDDTIKPISEMDSFYINNCIRYIQRMNRENKTNWRSEYIAVFTDELKQRQNGSHSATRRDADIDYDALQRNFDQLMAE